MSVADSSESARLTGDIALIGTADDGEAHVLLIERGWPPYTGRLALPGGHVDVGERVDDASRRELREETGLSADRIELIGVYSEPGRDPRGRYVTWAYAARVDGLPQLVAGDDARAAYWRPLAWVLRHPEQLAFDHHQILTDLAKMLGLPS